MAATSVATLFSFSFHFDPQIQTLYFPFSPTKPRLSPKPFSTFKSSSPHSSSLTVSDNPFHYGCFLSNDELHYLLQTFLYRRDLSSSSLSVRVMLPHETDPTILLLAESFAESKLLPQPYMKFLAFLVKQYLLDRRFLMPHTTTLVVFYTQTTAITTDHEEEEVEACLAGTVELCFDKRGTNAFVPLPAPPRDKPCNCNMAVQKSLRRYPLTIKLLLHDGPIEPVMSSVLKDISGLDKKY